MSCMACQTPAFRLSACSRTRSFGASQWSLERRPNVIDAPLRIKKAGFRVDYPKVHRLMPSAYRWSLRVAPQLYERHRQDVLFECGALLETVVPACEIVEPAPVRNQAPVAIGD